MKNLKQWGEVRLSQTPKGIEILDGSADCGVVMVDNLGQRDVFVPKLSTKKQRARLKTGKPVASWAARFRGQARGRVTAHTYSRENGTTTIFPVSEEFRQMLLGEDR